MIDDTMFLSFMGNSVTLIIEPEVTAISAWITSCIEVHTINMIVQQSLPNECFLTILTFVSFFSRMFHSNVPLKMLHFLATLRALN